MVPWRVFQILAIHENISLTMEINLQIKLKRP
jgi:hypothetical protein